jgi:cell division protein FtsB
MNRVVTVFLSLLIAWLGFALWSGKGGLREVWQLDSRLKAQQELNRQLAARNAGLDAEVRDLKQGFEALEERARSELGMIKKNEVFFQLTEKRQ